MVYICFLLGLVSVLYFLGIWKITGLSSKFPLIWLFIASCFFFAGGFFYLKIELSIVFRMALEILGVGFLLFFVWIEYGIIKAMHQREMKNLDYIVVLGAQVQGNVPSKSLQYRIDRAEKYLRQNENTRAVLSGGRGTDEEVSEAQCMFLELCKKGIASNRLFLEEKSKNTEQNIAFTIPILQQNSKKNFKDLKVGIVSNGFHIYRGTAIAQKKMCCKVYGIAAKNSVFLQANYLLREFFGVVKDRWKGNL